MDVWAVVRVSGRMDAYLLMDVQVYWYAGYPRAGRMKVCECVLCMGVYVRVLLSLTFMYNKRSHAYHI